MRSGRIITEDENIRDILKAAKTIAVLGLSPKPARDSYRVSKYMKENGYDIIPVRPAPKEILGEKVYASLNDLPVSVDIINAFRNPKQIMAHAKEALGVKPKVFWMQLGIENFTAALLLTAAGIDVVMNRCIKVDHGRLVKTK